MTIDYEESKSANSQLHCFQKYSLPDVTVSRGSCHLISKLLTPQCTVPVILQLIKDCEMSKQHEGFRFWENLEKKTGSQDSTPRSSQSVGRDGPKSLENRTSPHGFENRGTLKKEGPGCEMGISEPGMKPGGGMGKSGVKPGELARLEAVVSRLELEGGAGQGNSSRAIQVEAEADLLKRLALATSRIELSVGLAR